MERVKSARSALRTFPYRQCGASIVEAVIALPILLVVILGAIQFALIYEAKATLNHATLQAARLGAVRNADPAAIRRGLARGLAPLYSPDSSVSGVVSAINRIESDLIVDARIRILNPTREAFDDFGVDVDGEREIPNDRLHARSTALGARSGVNIQDANLLKVEVTYGYELQVPLVNWFIARVLLGFGGGADSFEQQLLRRTRLPIIATATVRMQSPARLSEAVVSISDFPELERIQSGSAPARASDEEQDETEEEVGDDPSPPSGEDEEEGSGLDDAFFGFGEGGYEDPAGGGSGGGSNWWDDVEGGGVNGGNPQQCLIAEPGTPFPFGEPLHGSASTVSTYPMPGFSENASGSATLTSVSLASLSVGNPIHVVTGNKFQAETDIGALPGKLSIEFRRYYNSSAVNGPSILGAGWRHGYQASLRLRDDGSVQIVQADGRLVRFHCTRDGARFVARRAGDGMVLAEAGLFKWMTPDGRELSFDRAGKLLRIEAHGAVISLSYDDRGELQHVEDSQGRKLQFEYYPNGRLERVRGPGVAVRYVYDSVGNLAMAVANDGRARRYTYSDHRHPHHLTGISVGNVRLRTYGQRTAFERVASWAYDERGRAVHSSHPADVGKVSLDFRDGYTEVTDAFGRKTRYMTGWRGDVAYVNDVRGPGCGVCGAGDAQYRYDDRFQLIERSRANEPKLFYAYDELGRLVRIERDVKGRREWLVRYAYDGETFRVARIERPSVKPDAVALIEFTYSDGLLVRRLEKGFEPVRSGYSPIQREVSYTYDSRKLLRRIDGPRSDVQDWIDLDYDVAARLVGIRSQDGEVRVLAHDRAGRPVHIERSGRPALQLRYDGHGRVAAIVELRATGPLEHTYEYDDAGRLVQIVDPEGRRIRYGFDAAGRPNRLTRSDSSFTTLARYAPDDRIERIFAVGPEGKLLRTLYFAYDEQRRLIEVRDGEGAPLQQFAYLDADSLPDRRTDPLGHETHLFYDPFGQLASVQAADGGVTRIERDIFGRVKAVVSPNGARTTYAYDDFGRGVAETSADRGELWFAYDEADNLIARTDARGTTIRLTYDAANRLVQVDRAEGTTNLEYENGLLSAVRGEEVAERYEYDADAQLIAHTRVIGGQAFATRFEYDARGRLTVRQLPSGARLRYRYDSHGRPESIVQERWFGDRAIAQIGSKLTTRLDAFAPLDYGNGIAVRTELDARFGNVSRRKIEQVASFTYDYDAAGRITFIKRGEQGRGFQYDEVGRLIRTKTPAERIDFEYDLNGNRMSHVVSSLRASCVDEVRCTAGEGSSPAVVDALKYDYAPNSNRLLAVDGKSYVYDEAGLPIAIGTRRYEYDTNGRPIRMYEEGKLVAEYDYNFWGERIRKRLYSHTGSAATMYIYEQQRLVAEADARGRVAREYVYLGHHPIAVIEGGRLLWIHTDHLGTPIAVTDEKRRVIWRAEYRPFGEATVDPDPDGDGKPFTLNLRFPGQYADAESGTHYNYFRHYDPATGRYLTPDPIGLAGGMNPFLYAEANPSSKMDLLGLYQQDVHYYMTLFLAITAGVDPTIARYIALASAFVDENPTTRPLEPGSLFDQVASVGDNQTRLLRYHFVLSGEDGQTIDRYRNSNVHAPIIDPSPQMQAMLEYATRLPAYAEGFDHCRNDDDVHIQFLGEYLHGFADTFAHRDRNNRPFDAWLLGHGVGHGFSFSQPDYTYNAGGWQTREARTFSMELALREQIRNSRFANPERAITDSQLDIFFAALERFNQTREDEESIESHWIEAVWGPLNPDVLWTRSTKVGILNEALRALGYEGIDLSSPDYRFDLNLARERRRSAFDALDPRAYPLAIIETP